MNRVSVDRRHLSKKSWNLTATLVNKTPSLGFTLRRVCNDTILHIFKSNAIDQPFAVTTFPEFKSLIDRSLRIWNDKIGQVTRDVPVPIRRTRTCPDHESKNFVSGRIIWVCLEVAIIHQGHVLTFVFIEVDHDLVSFGHGNHQICGGYWVIKITRISTDDCERKSSLGIRISYKIKAVTPGD